MVQAEAILRQRLEAVTAKLQSLNANVNMENLIVENKEANIKEQTAEKIVEQTMEETVIEEAAAANQPNEIGKKKKCGKANPTTAMPPTTNSESDRSFGKERSQNSKSGSN